MFDGFARDDAEVEPGVRLRFRWGGSGPPLLLLHGNPLTHLSWHKVAGRLAESFTVVAPDLRGYGDSSAPEPAGDLANYSFRAMAGDQVALMGRLGFPEFSVAGHDRGARVAHRMCLDHPERVRRAALLDIAPTEYLYTHTSKDYAEKYWHWSFMLQPFAEHMLGAVDPGWFVRQKIGRGPAGLSPFPDDVLAEYVRCFDEKTIRGSCNDYRATATVDLALDTADRHRSVATPLLVLWGAHSHVETVTRHDVLDIWRERADDVRGRALACGHYVPEEAPEAVLAEFAAFF